MIELTRALPVGGGGGEGVLNAPSGFSVFTHLIPHVFRNFWENFDLRSYKVRSPGPGQMTHLLSGSFDQDWWCPHALLSTGHLTRMVSTCSLEHVDTIRDLGVILDQKLTFGPHIDNGVKKANKTLGLLIRSFQAPKFGEYINLSSVRVSYFAHVRSLLEYCSVVWAGAAKTQNSYGPTRARTT